MTVITDNIPSRPKTINLVMYDKIYTKKAYINGMDNYVMECPIHGEFTIPASYSTPEQEFITCPGCVSFCKYLSDMYGKDSAFVVIKDIYRFAWDNKIIIDRIKKAITNPEDKCHMIYKLIKEKVKGYKEPPLLSEMIADLENISEDEIVFDVTTEKDKVTAEPKPVVTPPTPLDEFKRKLKEITLGTIEFVDLENKPHKALTELVAICPIHGSVYTTSLADMYAHRIQCEHCIPYYNGLVEKYNEKEAFKLVISIYDEYIRYKREYPNVALSLKATKMLNEVKPDYAQYVVAKVSEQPDQPTGEKQPQYLGTLNVREPNPTTMGSLRFMDKDWNDLPQPVRVVPKLGKAAQHIEFFTKLTVDDIKSLHIESDLCNDREIVTVTLKSGKVITITD